MKSFHLNDNQFVKVSGFLNIGYKDYLAARTLIGNMLLYRGVIVSATSIEKLLKVYLILQGSNKKSHNVEKLFKEALKFDEDLNKAINPDFIKFLSEAYNLRYFDNDVFHTSNKNFLLSVPRNKLMAELDKTALTLLNSWKMEHNGVRLESEYNTDQKEKKQLLFRDNYVLTNLDRKEFVEQKQLIYEINNRRGGILELQFMSSDVLDDGAFCSIEYKKPEMPQQE